MKRPAEKLGSSLHWGGGGGRFILIGRGEADHTCAGAGEIPQKAAVCGRAPEDDTRLPYWGLIIRGSYYLGSVFGVPYFRKPPLASQLFILGCIFVGVLLAAPGNRSIGSLQECYAALGVGPRARHLKHHVPAENLRVDSSCRRGRYVPAETPARHSKP